MKLRSVLLAILTVALTPVSALAVGSTTVVTGTVTNELAINAATPAAALTLSHSTAATTSASVAVVATIPWSLSIADKTGSHPGFLATDKCVVPLSNKVLAQQLQWRVSGGTYANLNSTDQQITTGSSVDTVLIDYSQSLLSGDGVVAGDLYCTTVTYTLSAT